MIKRIYYEFIGVAKNNTLLISFLILNPIKYLLFIYSRLESEAGFSFRRMYTQIQRNSLYRVFSMVIMQLYSPMAKCVISLLSMHKITCLIFNYRRDQGRLIQ